MAGGCLATGGRSLSLGSRLQPALLHPVRPPAPQINYGPQQDTTLHQRQHSAPSSHINAQSRATSGNIIETEACRNVWFTSAAKQGVLMCCHICNDLRFFGPHLDFLFSVWVRHQSVKENVQEYEMFNFLIIIEWVISGPGHSLLLPGDPLCIDIDILNY